MPAGIPAIVTSVDAFQGGFGNSNNLPQLFTENEFNYKDDLSITHGTHNFKMGAGYTRTRNGSSFDADFNGLFLPYGVEDILTDMHFGGSADSSLLVVSRPAYLRFVVLCRSVDQPHRILRQLARIIIAVSVPTNSPRTSRTTGAFIRA